MSFKKFLIIPAIGVIAALSLASAAALGGISGPTLGASSAPVASCDSNGVTVAYTGQYFGPGPPPVVNDYVVTHVTVSDVDPACDGGTIFVVLTDGSHVQLSNGTLAVTTGGSTVVPMSGGGLVELVEGVHIAIAGP